MMCSAFPSHIEVDSLVVAKVDHKGVRLAIPHCAVILTVPEGAVDRKRIEEVYVAVCKDPADRPKLSGNHVCIAVLEENSFVKKYEGANTRQKPPKHAIAVPIDYVKSLQNRSIQRQITVAGIIVRYFWLV